MFLGALLFPWVSYPDPWIPKIMPCVLEEVEKFCYFGDMFNSYGGASKVVSAKIGSAWEKFSGYNGLVFGKQDFSLKQSEEIYQSCVRQVLLYCSETRELTVAEGMRLHGVEQHIAPICRVKLVDRVSNDVIRERVGVFYQDWGHFSA